MLLTPLSFRNGKTSPNRIALAAMTNSQSHADGTLSDEELAWLARRAQGGFGIVTTCASHVSKDGQGWPGELGCFGDEHVEGLRRIAEVVHASGGLGLVQIFHGGLRADPAVSGVTPWSASDGDGVRGASEDDLRGVIAAFAAAARRVERAGLDGVEVHGAHGYLLTQFLSSIENRRTDDWGGSLANRARLLREVTRAVRAAVQPGFLVGVRLSPEDFGNARGLDLEENLQVARWLVEDGVDFLHLSLWDVSRNTTKRPDAHALPLFRAAVPEEIRLFAAGKIWTAEDGERTLALGADVVALGRSAIANPEWPRQIAEPGWQPRRPPLHPDELRARGLSSVFVDYMRRWKNFVAG